jgi:hypothetical protein
MVPTFGRFKLWFIARRNHPEQAWTGAAWTSHDRGIPTGDVQVCNFPSSEEARLYIDNYVDLSAAKKAGAR